MSRFSLATYTIRVRKRYGNTPLTIGNFGPSYDLFDLFGAYLSRLNVQMSHDRPRRRLLQVTSVNRDPKGRMLDGVIKTGEYGYEAELYDTHTELKSYDRKTTEAEMIPFYFLVSMPENANEGILVLQRFRNFGIRKFILDQFRTFFQEAHEDFTVDFNPLMPNEVIRRWTNEGKVTKIKFVTFALPKDMADALRIQNHEEVSSELVIMARRGKTLRVSRLVTGWLGRQGEAKLAEFGEESGLDFDTVKVEFNLASGRRTVDVNNPGRLRAYHDISDRVEIGKSGHPTLPSIRGIARELLKDLSVALGHEAG